MLTAAHCVPGTAGNRVNWVSFRLIFSQDGEIISNYTSKYVIRIHTVREMLRVRKREREADGRGEKDMVGGAGE